MPSKTGMTMTFMQHLEVLRKHLLRMAAAVFIASLVCFVSWDFLFNTLLFGPKDPDFATYRAFCWLSEKTGIEAMCLESIPLELLNTQMSGQFSLHIWLSIMGGMVIAFPYIVYEIWRFIAPGLTDKERGASRFFILVVSGLFFLGAAFGYYLIVPLSVQFLANYTISPEIQNIIEVSSYLSMVASVSVACGFLFELPVLIYFLVRMGLVTATFLRTYRRHALIILLIVAAVITPPDVMSQILVTLPLYALFEVGILVASWSEKNDKQHA